MNIKYILHVYSKHLYDIIRTLHSGGEYKLRQTIKRIRNSFEDREIDVLRRVPNAVNGADGLTKRSPQSHRFINKIGMNGTLGIPAYDKYELESAKWK